MSYLGDFPDDATVYFRWNSNAVAGESITRATNGTISVYKDDNGTQTTTGVTDTEDADSLTGVHLCKIATTDSFYATGSEYQVVLSAATIDGKTINAVLAHFSIERAGGALALLKGANGLSAIKTQTAAIETDTADIQSRLPAALVSGRIDASVGAMASNVMTAAAAAADLTTELQSGLATQASVDTIDDFLDTEVAAIKAKTDLIPGTIDGKTFAELVTLMASVLLGKASGLATTTAVYRAVDDSKDRVTATVDSNGNRSAVTLDAA